MTALPPILTDRSRYQTFLDCPRRRWWAYEADRGGQSPAGGWAPAKLVMPLATGIHVHAGIAFLLSEYQDAQKTVVFIEEAVAIATAKYRDEIAARGLACETGSDAAFTAAEQVALVEALIRAWALVRLPVLLAEYEVVDVERERELTLVSGDPPLVWQSRADGLLRRRSDGSYFVLSLKTPAMWDRRREAEARHDVQGLSEAAAIEANWAADQAQRLNLLEQADINLTRFHGNRRDLAVEATRLADLEDAIWAMPTRIDGVLMDFLLKGERKADDAEKDAGGAFVPGPTQWRTHSPLIRGRRRLREDPVTLKITTEYAWSFYWRCSAPHPMRKSKWYPTAECPGDGRRHKLNDDWETFNVWEQTDPFRIATPAGVVEFQPGVAGWIAALDAGVIQPDAGPCLSQQFVTPPPYRRQQQDIDSWRRSATAQESALADSTAIIRACKDPGVIETRLDEWFPMNRRACDWPSACPFIPVCHEATATAAEIDMASLGYVPRQPHHEAEAATLLTIPESEDSQ